MYPTALLCTPGAGWLFKKRRKSICYRGCLSWIGSLFRGCTQGSARWAPPTLCCSERPACSWLPAPVISLLLGQCLSDCLISQLCSENWPKPFFCWAQRPHRGLGCVRHLQCTAQSCVAGEDDSGWGEMRQLPCWDKWNISVSQSADASCFAPDVLGPDLSARWLRSSVGETPLGSCVVRPGDVPAVEMRETPEPLLRGARDGCKDCYKCLLVWIFCLLKINTLQLWDTSTYVQEPELNQQIVVWSLELSSGTRGCCADLLASMICKL